MNPLTRQDFDIYITSDVAAPVEIRNEAGQPLSLIGLHLTLQLRETMDGVVVFEASTRNGLIVVTDAAAGQIRFDWDVAAMQHLQERTYLQGLVADQGALRSDVWIGNFFARRGVARVTE